MSQKKTKKQKKIETVMHEWKEGALSIGKSNKKVKNKKQAIAIALSVSSKMPKTKKKRKK